MYIKTLFSLVIYSKNGSLLVNEDLATAQFGQLRQAARAVFSLQKNEFLKFHNSFRVKTLISKGWY